MVAISMITAGVMAVTLVVKQEEDAVAIRLGQPVKELSGIEPWPIGMNGLLFAHEVTVKRPILLSAPARDKPTRLEPCKDGYQVGLVQEDQLLDHVVINLGQDIPTSKLAHHIKQELERFGFSDQEKASNRYKAIQTEGVPPTAGRIRILGLFGYRTVAELVYNKQDDQEGIQDPIWRLTIAVTYLSEDVWKDDRDLDPSAWDHLNKIGKTQQRNDGE